MKKNTTAGKNQGTPTPKSRVVLIGTYKGDQLTRWSGWYNYPIFDDGEESANDYSHVTELWLFKGTHEQRSFAAEFVGIKTREDLVRDYGYPARGEPHARMYALFKTTQIYPDESESILKLGRAIIRMRDFKQRSPKVWRQLKRYLESPERDNPTLSAMLPKVVLNVPRDCLCVCESAVQMYLWEMPEAVALKPEVPFPPPRNPKFTFIDLFAGIGGFRLAMQSCGGLCVFSSEWDMFAQKTYEANYGEVPYGDITKEETKAKIPQGIDIVCAGFPCQAFSLAGKRMGFEDNYKGLSRGTLFQDVVEICERHKPKAIFCENVKGLVIHDRGRTFKVIKGAFEEIGYRVFYAVRNSMDFGVPQHRERIYIVAFRNDLAPQKFEIPEGTAPARTIRDILERDVGARYYLSETYVETLKRHRARHEAAGHGFGYVIRDLDGVSGAIVCGGMGRETNLIIDPQGVGQTLTPETHIKGLINRDGIRKMTPREWARLQGYPEEFKLVLADTHLYKQFGNSVSVPAVTAIAEAIVKELELANG